MQICSLFYLDSCKIAPYNYTLPFCHCPFYLQCHCPGVAAREKIGVASLRRFWCGMGGLKLRYREEVCGHIKGVKIEHFHTIRDNY